MADQTHHPIADVWIVAWDERNLWYIWLQYKLANFWGKFSDHRTHPVHPFIIVPNHLIPCDFILLAKSQNDLAITHRWTLGKPNPVVCLFDSTGSVLNRHLNLPQTWAPIWIQEVPPLEFI